MSAPADSAEGRWLARLRERRREGALHVAALEDVEALIAERDEARAEVERLRHHASGMEDELRYGEEVCAKIVDERDWLLSKIEGVGVLIGKNGCDCECDHDAESHDEICERCLACRISETLWPPLGSRR